MNKARISKKIVIILLSLFIIFLVTNQVLAIPARIDSEDSGSTSSDTSSIGEAIQGAEDFIKDGEDSDKIKHDSMKSLVNQIYNILLSIGIVITVIIGLVLGIQFMIGSIEVKSKVKESLIPYVVGCVVIYGAFGIWKIVVSMLSSLN